MSFVNAIVIAMICGSAWLSYHFDTENTRLTQELAAANAKLSAEHVKLTEQENQVKALEQTMARLKLAQDEEVAKQDVRSAQQKQKSQQDILAIEDKIRTIDNRMRDLDYHSSDDVQVDDKQGLVAAKQRRLDAIKQQLTKIESYRKDLINSGHRATNTAMIQEIDVEKSLISRVDALNKRIKELQAKDVQLRSQKITPIIQNRLLVIKNEIDDERRQITSLNNRRTLAQKQLTANKNTLQETRDSQTQYLDQLKILLLQEQVATQSAIKILQTEDQRTTKEINDRKVELDRLQHDRNQLSDRLQELQMHR